MIDILNRWTKVVLFHSETADSIGATVLESQALENKAVLAVLSDADLRGAVLRDAVLSGAKQYVLRIQGSCHEINAIDDDVRVGCVRQTLAEWLLNFEAIGKREHYTTEQIAEYCLHLKHIAAVLELHKKEQPNA